MRNAIAASALFLMSSIAVWAEGNLNAGPNDEGLRQQVQDNLSKAGFTDISIMPSSFIVRAKDQSAIR